MGHMYIPVPDFYQFVWVHLNSADYMYWKLETAGNYGNTTR